MTTRWLDQLLAFPDATAVREFVRQQHPTLPPSLPHRVAIAGAAGIGAQCLAACRTLRIEIAGLFDGDPRKAGTTWQDHTVRPLSALAALPSEIPLVLATHRLGALRTQLTQLGDRACWPFPLLALCDPRFPAHPFYDGLWDECFMHRERYRQLARQLHDDHSRTVLNAVIGFRLTLDPAVLHDWITPHAYFPPDLLHFRTDEIFVDGGAYDGDTIAAFLRRTGDRYTRIIACEPHPEAFAQLRRRYADLSNVSLHACGLHRQTATLALSADGRGAALAAHGDTMVPVTTLDAIPEAFGATFIKLNIEGAEPDALAGATHIIRTSRPRMAVAAYHRPSHLWELAEQLLQLRPDYQLSVRQHDAGIIETVLYAV